MKKKFDKQHRKYQKIESAYSIQNILWLIASIGVFYYTDFYLAVRYDPRVNRYGRLMALCLNTDRFVGSAVAQW